MKTGEMSIGKVVVDTSNHRGMPVNYWSKLCVDRLMQISEHAPEPIKQQALEYKQKLHFILHYYMLEAIKSYQTTLKGVLNNAGHKDIADGLPEPEV